MPASSTIDRSPATENRNVTLRVTLPAAAIDEYESQAKSHGLAIEDVMSARLLACIDHTAGKPLYFTDAQRHELEHTLGRNVKSTGDALRQIQAAMSVKVEKVVINLKLNLLQKLKTRCLGVAWEKYLETLITHELERYVGLR